jgi:hypothetical protein
MRFPYKPFAIIAGVVAGKAAGAIFEKTWASLAKQTKVPLAMDQERRWAEVIVAAMLRGAVFGGVKAVVDRSFATGYFRRTGVWPGKTAKRQHEGSPPKI